MGRHPGLRRYCGLVKSVLIAGAVGALVGLLAHQLGLALIVLGLVLVVGALLLTLTVIGAVVGIPLLVVGVAGVAFGAAAAGGPAYAVLLGLFVAVLVYARLRRRERRDLNGSTLS